jgi:hypothetical protein
MTLLDEATEHAHQPRFGLSAQAPDEVARNRGSPADRQTVFSISIYPPNNTL